LRLTLPATYGDLIDQDANNAILRGNNLMRGLPECIRPYREGL
jgi:hypothetical protein